MKNLFLLFCMACMVSACTSSKNIVKLTGIKWALQSMNGQALDLQNDNSEVFLQFNEAEKRVSGKSGCNRFFGTYDMEGESLKFSPMGATKMACPDMTIETEFFKMLDAVDHFSIKGNQLILMQKNTILAKFKKAGDDEKDKK